MTKEFSKKLVANAEGRAASTLRVSFRPGVLDDIHRVTRPAFSLADFSAPIDLERMPEKVKTEVSILNERFLYQGGNEGNVRVFVVIRQQVLNGLANYNALSENDKQHLMFQIDLLQKMNVAIKQHPEFVENRNASGYFSFFIGEINDQIMNYVEQKVGLIRLVENVKTKENRLDELARLMVAGDNVEGNKVLFDKTARELQALFDGDSDTGNITRLEQQLDNSASRIRSFFRDAYPGIRATLSNEFGTNTVDWAKTDYKKVDDLIGMAGAEFDGMEVTRTKIFSDAKQIASIVRDFYNATDDNDRARLFQFLSEKFHIFVDNLSPDSDQLRRELSRLANQAPNGSLAQHYYELLSIRIQVELKLITEKLKLQVEGVANDVATNPNYTELRRLPGVMDSLLSLRRDLVRMDQIIAVNSLYLQAHNLTQIVQAQASKDPIQMAMEAAVTRRSGFFGVTREEDRLALQAVNTVEVMSKQYAQLDQGNREVFLKLLHQIKEQLDIMLSYTQALDPDLAGSLDMLSERLQILLNRYQAASTAATIPTEVPSLVATP